MRYLTLGTQTFPTDPHQFDGSLNRFPTLPMLIVELNATLESWTKPNWVGCMNNWKLQASCFVYVLMSAALKDQLRNHFRWHFCSMMAVCGCVCPLKLFFHSNLIKRPTHKQCRWQVVWHSTANIFLIVLRVTGLKKKNKQPLTWEVWMWNNIQGPTCISQSCFQQNNYFASIKGMNNRAMYPQQEQTQRSCHFQVCAHWQEEVKGQLYPKYAWLRSL